ncbi:hypothetical protein GJ629_12700 [Halapricum sp. CBA1109]|uniref:DUF7139 domain-containing protein n=1 Tax=Halapricum sp. CBA1109 TaxID=2668068 RepID=UPI0012F730E1|nr:hypothetical protein [Halapricum sp. CBA1109]MUV90649.1 hypothetical protein [Halapricum sp. CBA1109]
MASLTDTYDGRIGAVASRRRRYLGVGCFLFGASLVVAGIVTATTDLAASLAGLGTYQARELAGVLAGLGLPAIMGGAFVVLPTGKRTRAAAVIGVSVTLLGVALFWAVYPTNWIGGPDPSAGLTLATMIVYFAGAATTCWCLFVGVATFKTRKSPGGTARMQVTEEGRIKLVETADERGGLGGIGLFGSTPSGSVPTQTNRDDGTDGDTTTQAASDGGTATADGDAEFVDAVSVRGQPDQYCGNCEQFSYVRTDDGIAPYCGYHGEYMDDMDACEEWEPNY